MFYEGMEQSGEAIMLSRGDSLQDIKILPGMQLSMKNT